jgi:lipopolysaccharide/colanic/teichoic acid biosynthesis glycosyltransferase
MKEIKKSKLAGTSKKVFIVLFFLLMAMFLLESNLADTPTFSVTYVDSQKIYSEYIKNTPLITDYDVDISDSVKTPQKSHAPELNTIFLLLGGVAGVFVRFIRKSFERLKRATDIILSIITLVFCSPFLFVSAILIKLTSKGPVIYKQRRVGRYGKIFEIYKLRTMHIDAEKDTGAVWAERDDPRVTDVGRILRKLHIDEIPQLLNVLRGQMSIVGPRPERPELVRDLKTLICDYEKRLAVRPGITGLAQVWHKYDETLADVRKKIKYDLLYIRKMCLMVDLRIFFRTFLVVLSGKQAQ